ITRMNHHCCLPALASPLRSLLAICCVFLAIVLLFRCACPLCLLNAHSFSSLIPSPCTRTCTAAIEDAASQQTVELKVNRVQIDNQVQSPPLSHVLPRSFVINRCVWR